MKFSYDYTRLLVPNYKECFLFYRNVMGFQVTYGSQEAVYADFDTGGHNLALFDRQRMSEAVGTSHVPVHADCQDRMCLVFGVADVDSASRELIDQGVPLVAPPADRPDWGIRTAHFRDPAGNLVEIYQDLPQEAGA